MHREGVRLVGELVPYLQGWQHAGCDYGSEALTEILARAGEYGMVVSYHTRRERSQRLYPGEITAVAHYRSGCILLERGDVTNAVLHFNDAARLGNAKAKEMLRCLRLAP